MYLKIFFFVLLLGSLDLIDAVFSQCPVIMLSHGKIRYSNRGRKIRFTCFKPYTLIGNTRLDCEDGEWSGAPPVCASKNCEVLPKLHHGKIIYYNDRAIAKIQCDPDFTLIGSSDLHCEVQGWNDTIIPECLANSVRQIGSCDFEPDETQQCKWISKSGFFNWTIMSSDPEENSHMPLDTFPVRDHTSLSNSSGHFLYLEGLFAPTKKWLQMMDTKNAPARYISPLLPPIDEEESYCLIFYLYANGTHAGIIEVFANEESLWKSNGSLGTKWNKIKIPLNNRSTQFRITIAGKGELGRYTRTAIDDLRIADREECQDENHQTEESTDDVVQISTAETPVPVSAIIENTVATERSNELQNHLFSLTPSTPHESNKSTVITTPNTTVSISTTQPNFDSSNPSVDNHTGTSPRPINKDDLPKELNAPSKSTTEEIPTTTSSNEIIITENDIVYHSQDENKSNDSNNIIEEEEVYNYSPKYHKNHNELHTEISTTKLPPAMKQEFQREKEAFYNDLSALKHYLPEENSGVTVVSITKITHLTTVLNNAVVESNDTKYEYDHEEDNHPDEINHERNDPQHFANMEHILQENHDQIEINSNSPYSNKSSKDRIISNKILWAILIAVICVLLLVVVTIYKRYRNRNAEKDDGFMQFIRNDSDKRSSSRKKDDILMMKMKCIPQ